MKKIILTVFLSAYIWAGSKKAPLQIAFLGLDISGSPGQILQTNILKKNLDGICLSILNRNKKIKVQDRTKVEDVLREYELMLSGLSGTNITDIDSGIFTNAGILLKGSISEVVFKINKETEMLMPTDTASQYRGRIEYQLHLELFSLNNAKILWSGSLGTYYTSYEEFEKDLDPDKMIIDSFEMKLRELLKRIKWKKLRDK